MTGTMRIHEMFAGPVRPLGPGGHDSAIEKGAIAGPWTISRLGLAGDHQADLKHHGGPDKALHHYARDHYAYWREILCSRDVTPMAREVLRQPPAFGENISTAGIVETQICIGDVVRIGGVTLQVSQGRQPCWKLNIRFDIPDMAVRVQTSGRTGWYYRVLEPGVIASGDGLLVHDRPHPDWPVSRATELLYTRTRDFDALDAMSRLEGLAEGWRRLAARRVAARKVEDWTARLEGP